MNAAKERLRKSPEILEQEYLLRTLDVDLKGTWMPSAIFTRMQETAEDHAELAGAARARISEELGICWVVTRMHLQMVRYPRLAEKIIVSTWPMTPKNLLINRQFLFRDMDGDVLGRASSQWVLFDLKKRAVCRISVLGSRYPHDPKLEAVLPEPKRISLPNDVIHRATREVMYSDVDMNGHMNNTKYLNWICELYPSAVLATMDLGDVRLNYVSEAHIGQKVDLWVKEDDEGTYVCGKTGGKTVFDSYVRWKATVQR